MISWILVPWLWAALVIFGNGNGSMRTKGPVLNRLNHPGFHGWIAPSWLRWGSNRSDNRLDFHVLFIFVRSQDHFAVHVQSSNVAISSSHYFGMKPPASLGGFYSDGHFSKSMGDHRPPLPVNRVTSPPSYRWTPWILWNLGRDHCLTIPEEGTSARNRQKLVIFLRKHLGCHEKWRFSPIWWRCSIKQRWIYGDWHPDSSDMVRPGVHHGTPERMVHCGRNTSDPALFGLNHPYVSLERGNTKGR